MIHCFFLTAVQVYLILYLPVKSKKNTVIAMIVMCECLEFTVIAMITTEPAGSKSDFVFLLNVSREAL